MSTPQEARYYYRARYYDPKIGRFISEDPIGFAAGVNFYGYVSGRPTLLVDPLGLDALTKLGVTWYRDQAGMWPGAIAAEEAHEAQHRHDFWWTDHTMPGWKYEQRGFAAEIPVLEARIAELRRELDALPGGEACPSKDQQAKALRAELRDLETEYLPNAKDYQDDARAKAYWNNNLHWYNRWLFKAR